MWLNISIFLLLLLFVYLMVSWSVTNRYDYHRLQIIKQELSLDYQLVPSSCNRVIGHLILVTMEDDNQLLQNKIKQLLEKYAGDHF